MMLQSLEKAAEIGRPVVVAHVRASRRRRPDAGPRRVIVALERQFTGAVATTGAAAGGVAAAPAVGLPAGLAVSAADAGAFTTAAALYVLALAEIHGIPTEDVVRRRTLMLGILIGESAQPTIAKVAGRVGPHWARRIVQKVPVESLRAVNRVLGRNFVTKYGTKQGILVLGKVVPFGIGVLIGAGGNAAFAQFTIRSARAAFGPPPDDFPPHLGIDEGDEVPDAVRAGR